MKKLFSVFFLSIFLVACQRELEDTSSKTAARTILNVSYGSDTAQRMDVYLPPNRTTAETKILILVHGGAWSSGDKTELVEYLPVLKQRLPDYAFFNINYRLAQLPSTNLFPTQENDVKAAFNAIIARAEEYGVNKEKLAVLGVSAGAHLALLQSYKNSTPRVKALVDMFGPTDLAALYNSRTTALERFAMQTILGGTPTTNAAIYQTSSPINFVSSQSPPTLILHGGADPIVPVEQSQALKAKLELANVPVQLFIYPSEGHGWFGSTMESTFSHIENFLKEHVK